MKKEYTIAEVVKEANNQLYRNIEGGFIAIIGCDLKCAEKILSNTRNNINNEDGLNRLSLKDYCKQEDYNSRCIYSILTDGKYNDDDEESSEIGLQWIERIEGSYNFKITEKGMVEIYGDYDSTSFPVITIFDGSIYIDETHEYFEAFIDAIKTHPLFEKCGRYNETLKERKMKFSKNELDLAKKLGIKLGIKELPNGKNEND